MKTSFPVLAAVLPLVFVSSVAQERLQASAEPKTKLEAFQAQTGAVVIKGYSVIGKVAALGTVEVDAMEFTDATSGRRQAGVVIEIKQSGRLETTASSFIDTEEIDSLLKGLDYISKATPAVTKLNEFEATYRTKGNFTATVFSGGGKIQAAVKAGNIGSATAYLSMEQLTELRSLVGAARQKFDATK